ncbi:AraC family transcriptional regulator [Niabella hirudinis]|uniref:AraC family transcriptional regulator n=1 Tax=Niabella hirudinis TaxID=1285929 RepID=UPI003EB78A43
MKPELIVDAPIMNQKRIWIKKVSKPHFDHPYHFHKLCEITWIEKGYGKLIIGDHVGNYSDNELVLLSPGLPHIWKSDTAFYRGSKKMQTKAMGLYFPVELISGMCDDERIIDQYNSLVAKAERGIRFYGTTQQRVVEKLHKIAASSGLAQTGIFLQILHLLSQSTEYEYLAGIGYRSSSNTHDMERFNTVYQYLLKHFQQDISLNEVAAVCNMTPSSFCRYFKQKTQKNFTFFLNEIRVGHAKKLLLNEQYSITNIGYECGYNNPVNFFYFFKLITQQTPGEYRNRALELHRKS